MPSWIFACEMRTDEERRRSHAFLAALREDPNVAHIDCHDDNPLNPYVMRVEVSCAEGISTRTVEILRTLNALAVPAVPESNYLADQLRRRGYLSLQAPMQVSQIDIRNLRPQGSPIRDDRVDAFAYAVQASMGVNREEPFTRHPITGFTRLQIPDPQQFQQEYLGTFRSEEDPEGDIVVNPRALARIAQDNAITREQDMRAFESMDRNWAQDWINRARREIQEDVDRDILDILARQDDVRRHLEAQQPPEPPKPKVPEQPPRTRFERINDD